VNVGAEVAFLEWRDIFVWCGCGWGEDRHAGRRRQQERKEKQRIIRRSVETEGEENIHAGHAESSNAQNNGYPYM